MDATFSPAPPAPAPPSAPPAAAAVAEEEASADLSRRSRKERPRAWALSGVPGAGARSGGKCGGNMMVSNDQLVSPCLIVTLRGASVDRCTRGGWNEQQGGWNEQQGGQDAQRGGQQRCMVTNKAQVLTAGRRNTTAAHGPRRTHKCPLRTPAATGAA